MFKKFFGSNKNISTEPRESEQLDMHYIAFKLLIGEYLHKNALLETLELGEVDEFYINNGLEICGLSPNIESVILNEWGRRESEEISVKDFAESFIATYHNNKLEPFAPNSVKERNKKLLEAYEKIIITIDRIQGLLDAGPLKTRIESELVGLESVKSTIRQCTTLFCLVSLGCDGLGRYNIIFSVDYRFQEMISNDMASTLLRRIYEFTPGEMESFVNIGSLCADCSVSFNRFIEEAKSHNYHKIFVKEKELL